MRGLLPLYPPATMNATAPVRLLCAAENSKKLLARRASERP
jgi:hypothetical protein